MKIHPVGGELGEQTDRHDETNSRYSKLCHRAWKNMAEPKMPKKTANHLN
jgi:hypothetical protein